MPYIGRNHITGDHTSNFKVLDDISSHTATFNGSSSTIVSTTDNTIRIPEHRFLQGQRVTYSNGSSTTTIAVTVGTDTVGGQSTGVFYFDGVEKPGSYAVKRGYTYIFDQSHATNEVYGGANHPLMFSTGSGGEHNGHGHYLTGITYKLDGSAVTMAGYVSGFNAATTRTVEWTIPANAPATLYYWCHHHTGQGNSFAISDGDIVGLVNGTAYYITHDTHNTIKLATSLSNANNNTNINLTSLGSGSSHSLTVGFDGINKIFKATHNGGDDVHINNSTQLQIAINNVVQKPNNDAAFTEGFRVIHGRQIQFKEAPTGVEIFWGTVIANTIESFDISDLQIDNFTGDGSTTDFVLSREVPNNQSVMVTIDGVTQHPSDKNNSRAYVIFAPNNIIRFTTAPVNNAEIQVRHLGFAGSSTGTVSGFYGRTGNVVLGSGDNITVGGINATGIITTPQFNVGNNIKLGNAGVITATSFSGSGANLTGIDATSIKDSGGNIKIQAQASGAIYTGIHTFNSDLDVDGHTNLDNLSVAGVGTIGGNLHVGGVLTYEDVTSIDSVGIITARSGIKVGTGVTIEPNGQATFIGIVTFGSGSTTIDNNVVNVGTALTLGHTQGLQFHTQNLHSQGFEVNQINASGIITATGGLTVAGVSTFTGDLTVDTNTFHVDSSNNRIGVGIITPARKLQIHQSDSTANYLHVTNDTTGSGVSDGALFGINSNEEALIWNQENDNIIFGTNNTHRLTLNNSGHLVPAADSTYDLGSNSVRFAKVYSDALYGVIQNTTHTNITRVGTLSQLAVSGTANPLNVTHTGANCVNLNRGSKSIGIDVNYGGSDTHSLVSLTTGMDLRFKLGGADRIVFKSAGHIEPQTDSQINLGSNTVRFANLYADTLYGNGANLTGIEAFVTGMILLWSGSAGSIPSGFVLCNGSNGTPDLRGRFVVGYHDSNGDYDVNDTGGAASVTLSTSQIPSHSHTTNNHTHSFSSSHTHGVSGSVSGSTNTTGSHSHTWQRQDVGINVGYRPWPASNNDVRSQDVSTSNAGDHSHSFSGSFSVTSDSGTASGTTGGQNPTTNNTGGGGSHENRPPYYALCYIMKT